MKEKKRYNPNTFNALHAAAAYLAYWAMTAVLLLVLKTVLSSAANRDGGIADYSPYYCLQAVLIAAGLALIVFIMCKATKVSPLNGGGFLSRRGCGMEMLMAAVLLCGMGALFMPLAENFSADCMFIREMLELPASKLPEASPEGSGWLTFYMLILVPVLPAIFEELLFRGVILRGLLQFGKAPAVILSALMFALAHGNPNQFIYQFLMGIAVGFLVVETKNLVVGMVAHFANNLFAVVYALVCGFTFLSREGMYVDVYLSIVEIMTYLVGAVCLIAACVYFGKLLYRQKSPETARGDVVATFVVNDMVSGTLFEEKPWYRCGELLPKDAEERCFLMQRDSRGKLCKKASFTLTAILLGAGIALAVVRVILAFIGIV